MSPLAFSPDCYEFIRNLNNYNVRWVIVGGEAVIYYGYSRLTGDVDFFFGNDDDNVGNLWNALLDFWDGHIPGDITEKDLKQPGYFIQFGVPPNRIDLMNQIDGVNFETVWNSKVKESVRTGGDVLEIYFISLNDLIQNKAASDRAKDNVDLKYLKRKNKE